MEKVGFVVSTEGNTAKLAVKKVSGCGTDCSACSGSCEQKSEILDINNTLGAKPGDFVEISTDSTKLIKYMLLIYGVPLLFLIVGFVAGFSVSNNEMYSLLAGVLALALGGFIVNRVDKKIGNKARDLNQMLRIL